MAPNAQRICVLRVVCREDFSMQSAESFVDDLKQALSWLDGHFIYTPQQLKALQLSLRWQGAMRRAVKARRLCALIWSPPIRPALAQVRASTFSTWVARWAPPRL